jgi:hypothetical protein
MYEQQLDLFSSASIQVDRPVPLSMELRPAATVLDDRALIAAIPDSNLADSIALAAEAGRRRLAAAVPSLEALCRRFSGFGIDRMVPEQAAALKALAVISGREPPGRSAGSSQFVQPYSPPDSALVPARPLAQISCDTACAASRPLITASARSDVSFH